MKIKNKEWKLDPKIKIEFVGNFSSDDPLKEIETLIRENQEAFLEEKLSLVGEFYAKADFYREKSARKLLIRSISKYGDLAFKNMVRTICVRESKKGNTYLLLDETYRLLTEEIEKAINCLFGFEINGKTLIKRKGETARHYLMKYIFLRYLNEKFGVLDFKEEYSKLKEVLRAFSTGVATSNEWEKVAKRADLYITLKSGGPI